MTNNNGRIVTDIVDRTMDIITLYNCVAIAMGFFPDEVEKYDCTKIKVSSNIAENVEKWYEETFSKEIGDNWKLRFGMDWCCSGPMEDSDLADNTAMVEDGFLKFVGSER